MIRKLTLAFTMAAVLIFASDPNTAAILADGGRDIFVHISTLERTL